jgi:hypothetical protein
MDSAQLSPTDKLAWHEEQIFIPLPPAEVYARLNSASLESLLPSTDSIPAVVGTEPLNELPFPNPGARRRVLLADGSSTLEEVMETSLKNTSRTRCGDIPSGPLGRSSTARGNSGTYRSTMAGPLPCDGAIPSNCAATVCLAH